MINSIIFNNQKFPVRELNFKEYGNILISTTLLNSQLILKDGSYFSDKARVLDEEIFYFVEPNDIYLSEDKLIRIIKLL